MATGRPGKASNGRARKGAGAGVDPDSIGSRLRAEREQRSISVRELARRLEISASALSQIETGVSRPSVRTLYAISSELGISLDDLFRPAGEAAGAIRAPAARPGPGHAEPVQRHDSRESIELETGVRWERLTPMPDPEIDFLFVTYDVGGSSSAGEHLARHSGREYGIVLEGRLQVRVGFETYELGPGDSICFDSSNPHRLATIGKRPARAVWFVVGRHASDPRAEPLRPAPER